MDEDERKRIRDELVKLAESGDAEIAHSLADDILCDVLTKLGYDDIVKAWAKVPKWYA